MPGRHQKPSKRLPGGSEMRSGISPVANNLIIMEGMITACIRISGGSPFYRSFLP